MLTEESRIFEDMHRRRYNSGHEGHEGHEEYETQGYRSEEGGIVEFHNVAVYVPALQLAGALLACCATCLASTLMGTLFGVSAVRTAVLGGIVGACALWKPMRLHVARGADAMFDALRPAMVVYMVALIAEQLAHSCGPLHTGALSFRHWMFYACIFTMGSAGFAQAWSPKAYTDYPFAIAGGALLVVAIFAPPPRTGDGPLCDPPSLPETLERIMRTLLFALSYCALAYASEPAKHTVREIIVCSARAAAGSMWVLAAHRYVMWLSILQSLLVLLVRLRSKTSAMCNAGELQPLSNWDTRGKDSDIEEGDDCDLGGMGGRGGLGGRDGMGCMGSGGGSDIDECNGLGGMVGGLAVGLGNDGRDPYEYPHDGRRGGGGGSVSVASLASLASREGGGNGGGNGGIESAGMAGMAGMAGSFTLRSNNIEAAVARNERDGTGGEYAMREHRHGGVDQATMARVAAQIIDNECNL